MSEFAKPCHHNFYGMCPTCWDEMASQLPALRTENAALTARVKDQEELCNQHWSRLTVLQVREGALLARVEKMREAFSLEEDKADKARDFILNQKCSCVGGGVGTPGGCDRCRALDYLSTFGWDFKEYALAKLGEKA